MDCSSPAVHGILQERILEWVAMASSGDLPNLGIEPASLMSPAFTGGFFTIFHSLIHIHKIKVLYQRELNLTLGGCFLWYKLVLLKLLGT